MSRKLIQLVNRKYFFLWKAILFPAHQSVLQRRSISQGSYNLRRTDLLTVEGDLNHLKVKDIDEKFHPSIDKKTTFHSRYLQELCRHGHLETALSWLNKIIWKEDEETEDQKLTILYEKVFYGYFARGATKEIIALHQLMKQRNIEPNRSIFSILIRTYCISPDTFKPAVDLYHEMRAQGIKPHAREYLSLISAASEIGDLDTAWSIFEKINHYPSVYDDSLMSSFTSLIKVLSKSKDEEWLQKARILSQFLQNNNLIPSDELLSELRDLFLLSSGKNWQARLADAEIVNGTLICRCCGTCLDRTHISTEEEKEIFKQWTDKIGNMPVVVHTSEKAKNLNNILLNKLKKLLTEKGPFDVVVDGLNIGYQKTNCFDPNLIKSVVEHYLNQQKTVLVVGAGPLKFKLLQYPKLAKTPGQKSVRDLLLYLTSTPFVAYFLMNQSFADDYYILYAAALSGPNTLLVSNDQMINHVELMERNLKMNMQRWLKTHQVKVDFTKNGHMKIMEPSKFILNVLIGEDIFHFPSSNEKKWLCVHKKNKEKNFK